MNLSNYDIIYLGKKADELGFIRGTIFFKYKDN